jgi:hypothetical protein
MHVYGGGAEGAAAWPGRELGLQALGFQNRLPWPLASLAARGLGVELCRTALPHSCLPLSWAFSDGFGVWFW